MTPHPTASTARPHEEPSDAEKIAFLETHHKACWACIQAGAQRACQHYRERLDTRRLEQSKINPVAVFATIEANRLAFTNREQDVSPIETRLLEAFWRAGLDPIQQYRIGGYVVDFAFPRARLVVEADGKEYHKDGEREQRRDEALRKAGWHPVHFTGSQIWQDADTCVRSVYRLARASLV